ncbi:MAG TPA: TonB system transport protein ExbD [Roseiarcus sp.]|nr:TonB system transport protein ExbD [Roseiarcus sp.]
MTVALRKAQDDDLAEISEINVTPFIDVILVLLIIFMVAAPLSTVDIAVDLPISTAEPKPRPDKPLYLTVRSDSALVLGEAVVSRGQLQAALDQLSGGDREQRVFIRADRTIAYGELMTVMNLMREAGYLKIALVALEDDGRAVTAPSAVPAPAGAERGAAQP